MKKTNFFVCIFICVFIFASSVKANEYSKAGDHLPQYGKKHIFMFLWVFLLQCWVLRWLSL